MNVRTTDYPEARAERCMGELCGLITSLEFRHPDRELAPFVTTGLVPTSLKHTVPGAAGEINPTASGGGQTVDQAIITSVGEFLERYTMYWRPEEVIVASYSELRSEARTLVELEPLQMWRDTDLRAAGMAPLENDSVTEWTRGVDLSTGSDIWLPVELIAFNVRGKYETHYPATTNGNACGSSLSSALVNSLYERIERDAVMRTWYQQDVPPRLDVSTFETATRLKSSIEASGYQVELLELSSPTTCPVVASALISDTDNLPNFLLFADAHLSVEAAVRGALLEAAEGLLQTKYRLSKNQVTEASEINLDEVYNLVQNVDYYMDPDNFDEVSHLFDGDSKTVQQCTTFGPADSNSELHALLELISSEAGATPIAVELTTDDVRELGMYTTGAYIPELLDISLPGMPLVDHPSLEQLETHRGHPFP